MNFRNVKNLSDDIEAWVRDLPDGIECIVGIPRSGMLVANLLALRLNLPVTDLDGFLMGRVNQSGRRLKLCDKVSYFTIPRKVLVVDDCISSGKSMTEVRRLIESAELPHDVEYACVYKNPKNPGHEWVSFYGEIPKPRVFEWNILSVSNIRDFCIDLDGVLCKTKIDINQKNEGDASSLIAAVKPLYVPKFEIGWIVSTRCEQYRPATENWLKENGFTYRELIMADGRHGMDPRDKNLIVRYKAESFVASGASLFIEKEKEMAHEISAISQRYVYCCDQHELFQPVGIGFKFREKKGGFLRKLRSCFFKFNSKSC